MDLRNDPQRTIDLEISLLERQIVDLKRRRNTFSLISRLPPEILAGVFVSGLAFDVRDVLSLYEDDRRPMVAAADHLTLCHVCHSWRTIALASPDIWAHLRVSSSASRPLLDFMLNNSKSRPMSLSVWDESRHSSRFVAGNTSHVADVLCSSLRRLRDLCIYMDCHPLLDLLSGAAGRADKMESLTIVGHRGGSALLVHGNPRLFSDGTPRLQQICLQRYVLPWTAPIFTSRRLAHLAIHNAPQPTLKSMVELVTVLKNLPALQHLYLFLDGLTEPFPTTGTDDGQVELSKLMYFHVHSTNVEPLSTILRAVRVPQGTSEVSIGYTVDALSKSPLQEVYSACKCAFPEGVAPEALIFDQDKTGRVNQVKAMKPAGDIDPRDPFSRNDTPWISLTVGITRDRTRNAHPFSKPELTTLMWSYTNLRFLQAQVLAISQAGWDDLARAPALEYIEVIASSTSFISSLRGRLSEALQSNRNSGSVQETVDGFSSRVRTDTNRQVRFPALKTLIFLDVAFAIMWRERIGEDHCLDLHPVPSWIKEVAKALRTRAGGRLKRLEFREIGEYRYTDEWDVAGEISSVAETSSWGDAVVE